MNILTLRAAFAVIFALTTLSLASPSSAQQKASPWPQQPPALSQSQPPALSVQAAPPAQAPAPALAAQPAPTPAASDAAAAPDGSRSLKSTTVALRELSPWSMFVSADILVKAVIVCLHFAPCGTGTSFTPKL